MQILSRRSHAPLRFPPARRLFALLSLGAPALLGLWTPASASVPAPMRILLGPDSNVCGITLPSRRPARKIGLILWLHGGMRSGNREKGAEAHRALLPFVDTRAYYLCSPSAFAGQDWLTPQGLGHIDALIDYMLAHYAVDPGDINLVGVSDGSLGVIAYSLSGKRALRRRVLISCYPQIVLPPESLPGRPGFATGSWDFLQGGHDRLFPAQDVVPYLKRWESLYPNAHLHYFPEGEHDFSFFAAHAADLLKSLFVPVTGKTPGLPLTGKTPGSVKPLKNDGLQRNPGKT